MIESQKNIKKVFTSNEIIENAKNDRHKRTDDKVNALDDSYKKIAFIIKEIINSAIPYSISRVVKKSKSIEELRKELDNFSKQIQVYQLLSKKAESIDEFKDLLINTKQTFPDIIQTLKDIYSAITGNLKSSVQNKSNGPIQDNSDQIKTITEELFDSNALLIDLFNKFIELKDKMRDSGET